MSPVTKCGSLVLLGVCGLLSARLLLSQQTISKADEHTQDRARTVLSKSLPRMEGARLKVTLVEVRYGPGEESSPHSHPCAVIGYVIAGTLRTQVEGEAEMIYKAGESFYEAPNGIHLVSANASSTEPAKLVAYLICDHDTPLTVDVPESGHPQGTSR